MISFNLGTQIKDTFGDIANFVIRMNPFNELSDVLGTVMSGILALGYRLASLYRPFTTPTTPGATPPATKAPVKTLTNQQDTCKNTRTCRGHLQREPSQDILQT